MVATLVVLVRSAKRLPDISTTADLREAIQSLAADVSVDDNLLGAELLWTPEDGNDVMDRDDMLCVSRSARTAHGSVSMPCSR